MHIYHPTHGPQNWPWWKVASVSIVRCSHNPQRFFWITPIAYNIWIYSRWGAVVCTWRVRRGVYDQSVKF